MGLDGKDAPYIALLDGLNVEWFCPRLQ